MKLSLYLTGKRKKKIHFCYIYFIELLRFSSIANMTAKRIDYADQRNY